MKLPDRIHRDISEQFGTITDVSSIGGGCINSASKIQVKNGPALFAKWNRADLYDMFAVEERGLRLLREPDSGLRIPEPLVHDRINEENLSYLVVEYIPQGRATDETDRLLGEGLARLHQHTWSQYGLDHDNYIGRLPQYNTPHQNWIDFFINQRLDPQLQMAVDRGLLDARTRSAFETLYKRLPELIAEEPASLLHGDLWGGNQFAADTGKPAVFDPAVYYGNREIELAFTHLFGGFGRGFYEVYEASWPLQPGFEQRKDLYNLYPLLVHVNLFGSVYSGQVKRIVSAFT